MAIRRGWFFGDKALKQELLGQMSERLGCEHYGEERQESQPEKAERVVAEEMKRRRWRAETLEKLAKGHPEKVKIADAIEAGDAGDGAVDRGRQPRKQRMKKL